MRLLRVRDLLIAVVISALCSFLVYRGLGNPGVSGIDDENITQVYGRNLANGFGYVYTPHFERVEGATSALWVAVHWLLYKITIHPEPYLLACSLALSGLAIYWSLGIARSVVAAMALPSWSIVIPALAICAQPNYFVWTVVSMMDQGLWSALMLGLLFLLVRIVNATDTPQHPGLGVVLCTLCVLARPESMLLLPLLLTLTGAIVAVDKGVKGAFFIVAPYYAAVLVTLVGLTAVRLAYFGYPLPNAYYAKISSNPVDNIVYGAHYSVWFLHSNVLVVPAVLGSVLGLMIGFRSLVASAKTRTPLSAAHRSMLLVGGSMGLVFAATILEGGDHFPGFRLFQPYLPVMSVALLFYVPLVADWNRLTSSRTIPRVWLSLVAAAIVIASYCAFPLMNHGIKEDFTLARDGRRLGALLNELSDQAPPDVGVLPAGGIALTYRGRVVDLLGINWTEMAHATGRRTGIPGHSAFNREVFWQHPPSIMLPTLIDSPSARYEKQIPDRYELSVLKGLMNEKPFRDDYCPVIMHLGGGEIFAYARMNFIDLHRDDPRIVRLSWDGDPEG